MDLVVMAAGMGSRFGGLKQIQPIDDDNNFIIDYSVFDAVRAGFDRIVFIIKKENYEIFESTIGSRLKNKVEVKYVFQSLDNVPSGAKVPQDRQKPWGTAHALYCCKDIVDDKFAVINADDFYGCESYDILAKFLRSKESDENFLNVGYYVKNTLSKQGSVKRGVIKATNNFVTDLVESEIKCEDGEMFARPLDEEKFEKIGNNSLVSMNMFGFNKKLMDRIERDCKRFFSNNENLISGEFLLPNVINDMIKDGEIKVNVIETPAKWFGITYKDDLEDFKSAISTLKTLGKYPKHLY